VCEQCPNAFPLSGRRKLGQTVGGGRFRNYIGIPSDDHGNGINEVIIKYVTIKTKKMGRRKKDKNLYCGSENNSYISKCGGKHFLKRKHGEYLKLQMRGNITISNTFMDKSNGKKSGQGRLQK